MSRTISPLFQNKDLQFIFVGGKGGVGKTTTSSSIAIELSKTRGKTLLISTDPAHNLSDAFDQQFTHEATQVEGLDNLWVIEIDPKKQLQNSTSLFQDDQVFDKENQDFMQGFLSQVPGIDEAVVFMNLLEMSQAMEVEVVVFDTAPTGHTLKMLSFPALIEKGLDKLNELKGKLGGVLSMFGMGGGDQIENMFGKLTDLKEKTVKLKGILTDKKRTTFVGVCIPEFLSVYETERLVQELTSQNINIDNIVVNQIVFPESGQNCRKCKSRYQMQYKYISQILELYEDFNISFQKQEDEEIRGVEALQSYAQELVREKNLQIPEQLQDILIIFKSQFKPNLDFLNITKNN